MTFADQVILALHLYDNPELTQVRSSYRLPRCNAESIGFYRDGTWYSVLKSRGTIIAVLISGDNILPHMITIGSLDRTGRRHMDKWHRIKNAVYNMDIPIFSMEGTNSI